MKSRQIETKDEALSGLPITLCGFVLNSQFGQTKMNGSENDIKLDFN